MPNQTREFPYGDNTVFDTNGKAVDISAAAVLMDEDIRENLNGNVGTEQEFFEKYAEQHEKKYKEEFAPYVGGAW